MAMYGCKWFRVQGRHNISLVFLRKHPPNTLRNFSECFLQPTKLAISNRFHCLLGFIPHGVCWWWLVHSSLKWVTKLSKKIRPFPHMGKWTITSGFTLFGSVHTDEVRDFFLALFTLFCFFDAVRVRVLLKWFLSQFGGRVFAQLGETLFL